MYIVLRIWMGAEMCHPSFSKGLPCIGHGPGRERRREARGKAGPFHVDQERNDLAAEAERPPEGTVGLLRQTPEQECPGGSLDARFRTSAEMLVLEN